MGDSSVRGQFGSKPQGGEHLVVVLDNLPDSLEGHGIGIHLVRVHVVQRSRLGWISFADGNRERVGESGKSEEKTEMTSEIHNQSDGFMLLSLTLLV